MSPGHSMSARSTPEPGEIPPPPVSPPPALPGNSWGPAPRLLQSQPAKSSSLPIPMLFRNPTAQPAAQMLGAIPASKLLPKPATALGDSADCFDQVDWRRELWGQPPNDERGASRMWAQPVFVPSPVTRDHQHSLPTPRKQRSDAPRWTNDLYDSRLNGRGQERAENLLPPGAEDRRDPESASSPVTPDHSSSAHVAPVSYRSSDGGRSPQDDLDPVMGTPSNLHSSSGPTASGPKLGGTEASPGGMMDVDPSPEISSQAVPANLKAVPDVVPLVMSQAGVQAPVQAAPHAVSQLPSPPPSALSTAGVAAPGSPGRCGHCLGTDHMRLACPVAADGLPSAAQMLAFAQAFQAGQHPKKEQIEDHQPASSGPSPCSEASTSRAPSEFNGGTRLGRRIHPPVVTPGLPAGVSLCQAQGYASASAGHARLCNQEASVAALDADMAALDARSALLFVRMSLLAMDAAEELVHIASPAWHAEGKTAPQALLRRVHAREARAEAAAAANVERMSIGMCVAGIERTREQILDLNRRRCHPPDALKRALDVQAEAAQRARRLQRLEYLRSSPLAPRPRVSSASAKRGALGSSCSPGPQGSLVLNTVGEADDLDFPALALASDHVLDEEADLILMPTGLEEASRLAAARYEAIDAVANLVLELGTMTKRAMQPGKMNPNKTNPGKTTPNIK